MEFAVLVQNIVTLKMMFLEFLPFPSPPLHQAVRAAKLCNPTEYGLCHCKKCPGRWEQAGPPREDGILPNSTKAEARGACSPVGDPPGNLFHWGRRLIHMVPLI